MTWVYKQTETPRESPPNGLYTVGFYGPEGEWEPETDHGSAEAAAERVNYLNGSKSPERDGLIAALREIASFDDERANRWLEATGSYEAFVEPASVEVARRALEGTYEPSEPHPGYCSEGVSLSEDYAVHREHRCDVTYEPPREDYGDGPANPPEVLDRLLNAKLVRPRSGWSNMAVDEKIGAIRMALKQERRWWIQRSPRDAHDDLVEALRKVARGGEATHGTDLDYRARDELADIARAALAKAEEKADV